MSSTTPTWMEKTSELFFFVNGRKFLLGNVEPDTTLIQFLRNEGLTGTKLGCAEGGCGACTIMLSHWDQASQRIINRSVNACLAPLCSVHGMAITTVEGIGSTTSQLHPLQERFAASHGSQCGFCTPGIIMSLYTLLRNNPYPSEKSIEDCLDGNLCRCTGYRPILEAAKSFANMKICPSSGKPCDCGGGVSLEAGAANSNTINNNDSYKIISQDLLENCAKGPSQPIFPTQLRKLAQEAVAFKGTRTTWYRPSTLDELLEIKKIHQANVKIVVGNTEVGIETKFKGFKYPVLATPVLIPELSAITETAQGVFVGASVTLANLESYLKSQMTKLEEHKTRSFHAILNQIHWFSGTQIRNVACVGGNIATASPISDLNPVFSALNSYLTLLNSNKERRTVLVKDFFLRYRVVDLKPDEIIESVFVPYTKPLEYIFSYKQARRRDDDIAIVTSGIRAEFELSQEGVRVKDFSISFGGMAPTTVSCRKTEQSLKGKLWSQQTFDDAVNLMKDELPLVDNAPGGMIEYRRSLTSSFLFKFFLNTNHCLFLQNIIKQDVPQSYMSAFEEQERPLTKGIQGFEIIQKGTAVGLPKEHMSAKLQVTGEAKYLDDIPKMAHELQGGLVLSSRPHAKITLDIEKAKSLKGAIDVFYYKDVPGSNKYGPVIPDEEVFAENKVIAVGQIIAVVIANTDREAQELAKEIERTCVVYEDLPALFSIDDAIANNSYFPRVMKIESGNCEEAFKTCDHVVEGDFKVGGQEHFYLEVMSTLAVPGEGQEFTIYSSTQTPYKTQKEVAIALGLDCNRVVCKVKRIGGGFGGKETRNVFIATAISVAAQKLRRPVRCILDRDVDMAVTGHRHPFLAKYKVGFNKDGKIIALDCQLFSNAGCTLDLSAAVMERAVFHIENCYKIPNIKCVGKCCKTNMPSNTAFRGFGGPQGMVITEAIVDRISAALNMRAETIRELNLLQENDSTYFGQKLENFNVPRMWKEIMASSEYASRLNEVAEFNQKNKFKKRGISCIPTKFGISFTALWFNQGGALVNVYTDGTVLVTHGGVEMGQGLNTKVCQTVASCFNIPLEKVHISETATDKVPNASPTAASISSDLYCQAAKNAADEIMSRLQPYKENENMSFEDLVHKGYMNRVNLSAQGFFAPQGIHFDFEKGRGSPFCYFTQGTSVSEVEIDCLTGDMVVRRTDICMDVGESINPSLDIGQIEGAFMQGLGLFSLEETVWGDKDHPWIKPGTLFTRGPGTYKIPSFNDVPIDFRVNLLRGAPNPRAVHSSKAIGEPPLFMAASVFFAIKDAINSARIENNMEGYFHLDSPATCERIRMGCADNFTLDFMKGATPEEKINQNVNYRAKGSF